MAETAAGPLRRALVTSIAVAGSVCLAGCGVASVLPTRSPSASVSIPRPTLSSTTSQAPEVTASPTVSAPSPTDTTTSTPTDTPTPTQTTAVTPTATPTASLAPSPTPTTSGAATPAADQSSLGWLWVLLAAAVVVALGLWWVLARRSSERKAALEELVQQTRAEAELQLPPVLAHVDAAVRGVAWPPARARLIELRSRWQSTAESTSDAGAKLRHTAIADLLANLVVAIDAETEAMNQGRDWSLLRPRVDELRASLIGQLAQAGGPAATGGLAGPPPGPPPGPTL